MKRTFILVLLFATTLIVASALGMLIANLPALLNDGTFNPSLLYDSPNAFAFGTLFAYILLFIILVFFHFIPFPLWRKSTAYPIHKKWIALSAIVFLALGLSILVSPFDIEDPLTMEFFNKLAHTPIGFFVLVLAGPLIEECVFREGILSAMRAKQYAAPFAAIVSALLFAIIHGNLAQAIPAFGIGLLLAIFYIGTNDIRLPFLGHFLNNALAASIILIPAAEDLESSMESDISIVPGVILTLIGIILAFAWWRIQRTAIIKEFKERMLQK